MFVANDIIELISANRHPHAKGSRWIVAEIIDGTGWLHLLRADGRHGSRVWVCAKMSPDDFHKVGTWGENGVRFTA